MRCADHLRLFTQYTAKDLKTFETIEQQARESISSEAVTEEFVKQIIGLFWDAYNIDRDIFIKDIFFQNQLALKATQANQDYIFDLYDSAKAAPNGQRKQIQLVNIYRNMVSDLFEPYLSILVACHQLKAGTFKSFNAANLSAAESSKYEFVFSKMQPTNLFNGYVRIIRNAASHTGSHSIRYDGDEIIFNKIKRQAIPSIDDVLKINTSQLIEYIQHLIDFTQSLDVAVNIMGLDMGETIWRTRSLAQEFHEVLITREQLAARYEERSQNYAQIWADEQLTFTDKVEHFRELYAAGCKKNNLPAKFLRVEGDFLIVAVPWKKLKDSQLTALVNRAAELCQYALLAEMYFYHRFSDYLVEEISEPGEETIQVWQNREDLKQYNKGNAHMVDLLQDGKIYKNYTYQPLEVNFELLDEQSMLSLQQQRKRKKRP